MAERRDRGEFFREMSTVILKTDSPIEAAQQMLQVDSPAEAALSFIQSEEEMNQLIELFSQRNAKHVEE